MRNITNPINNPSEVNNDGSKSVRRTPSYDLLCSQLTEANILVDDIILKNYLTKLTDLDLIPLDSGLKQISDIRLFKINKMVYQNEEYSTYKFASVFNSVQNLNCSIFIVADSNGKKTDFYMGVRSLDEKRTTKSLKDTLKNSLSGQFPGVNTSDLLDSDAESFLGNISSKNIASVSCVAKNKDEDFNDNERFIQGLEKLALAMHGQRYTAVILAKSTPQENLDVTRRAYEAIYTQLSPFANMQVSYGTNIALSISDAFSSGTSTGISRSTTKSIQTGNSYSRGITTNESETKTDTTAAIVKGTGFVLLGIASLITAPLTGTASLVAAGAIMAGQVGLNSINPSSNTKGTSESETWTESTSATYGETDSVTESTSENYTNTKGLTFGESDNMQLSMQNKTLVNTLERIDEQLKRIDECESLGMWECAAYFLSDSQETVEMAAGNYKALMKGTRSGVESSAINFWGHKNEKLPILREYITNFIHPIFSYRSSSTVVPVTASSLISGNELAIQMGLPRKSLCGFPVIEHADFGKEVVKYNQYNSKNDFILGKVFSMGKESDTDVRLDRDSLAMHTFITGSTGSGKSNTVYEIINQLRIMYNIPFLVIEPAKGEYKNIFGHLPNVSVYGTNPKKNRLLKINPFSFPKDIHVLEHLDRLVELFNVCWPMYAAMPAILKDAIERAYTLVGWNISTSENSKGKLFPSFMDVLEEIENVINESKYSTDSKGDYAGALCTRVRSLTTGLNGMIFRNDELSEIELFDKNVIVDLSRVGSTETKSLIMGLLVMKLNEHRMTSGKFNSPLRHVTILEEAHNLLKRTSTEQSTEGANLIGKSVELLSNSIAEMRTYGEGFIIVDQSPNAVDNSAIRNTNTKIILRLPDENDRILAGKSAALSDEQIKELAKLPKGVAVVYQNDWLEPVLCKVTKFSGTENIYQYTNHSELINHKKFNYELTKWLLRNRLKSDIKIDVGIIKKGLSSLPLRYSLREKIKNLLLSNNELDFTNTSSIITELFEMQNSIVQLIKTSESMEELRFKLRLIIENKLEEQNDEILLNVEHCLMKNLSLKKESYTRVYALWHKHLIEKGAIK